jgi:two-component system chemotaxis sensor kinase CheA
MTINLEQFHQTFFEESFEGLNEMESGLLHLEPGAPDADTINTIFRAAHSIKGGSGTFGFSQVANFTHVMETLLNEMRDGRRAVVAAVVQLLLESVDCLREMLAAVQHKSPVDEARVQELHARLESHLHSGVSGAATAHAAPLVPAARAGGWRIDFRPKHHLFLTGNDPLRIFRELAALGELTVEADTSALPELADLDPESCYLAWRLRLVGEVTRAAVVELFDWVVDDCALDIVPLADTAAAPAATTAERRAGADRRSGDRRGGGADGNSIRVDINKVDALINMVGELVITQSMLSQIGSDFDMARLPKLLGGLAELERNTRELQESVMSIRMLPISFAFNRFPRLVHDLSQKLAKKVELRMSGENTELDKTVLEKIVDPLVHLVRNSLDHGIESPAVRRAAGKPETGEIQLKAFHRGGNIVIEIRDDGAGLNKGRILEKARARGLVGADELPSDEHIYELIFQPGFSTAEVVSDVSGRGVGMDVVSRNIKSLGGTVDITSREGLGTTMSIRLPLTLAIVDGQSVGVGGENYIVPLVSIVESVQVKPGMVNLVAGKGEVLRLRDEYIPILRLHRVFGVAPRTLDLAQGLLVVVEGDGRRAGLFVDELLGQQQVVIKSLETNFRKVDGVAGATILGDGTVALILDVPGLIKLALTTMGTDIALPCVPNVTAAA